jgi:hypothetical protein
MRQLSELRTQSSLSPSSAHAHTFFSRVAQYLEREPGKTRFVSNSGGRFVREKVLHDSYNEFFSSKRSIPSTVNLKLCPLIVDAADRPTRRGETMLSRQSTVSVDVDRRVRLCVCEHSLSLIMTVISWKRKTIVWDILWSWSMLYVAFVDSYKLNPSFGAVAPTAKPQSRHLYVALEHVSLQEQINLQEVTSNPRKNQIWTTFSVKGGWCTYRSFCEFEWKHRRAGFARALYANKNIRVTLLSSSNNDSQVQMMITHHRLTEHQLILNFSSHFTSEKK